MPQAGNEDRSRPIIERLRLVSLANAWPFSCIARAETGAVSVGADGASAVTTEMRMGVWTRRLDIAIGARRQVADAAARAEARAGIERWKAACRQPGHPVVADDPGRADRRDALA
jgi:hypothetical protein